MSRALIIVALCCLTGQSFCQNTGDVELLSPKQISKLLPTKISGYSLTKDSKAKEVTVGTLSYSMCQRNFARAQRKIQLLLFDYGKAPIMYAQAIRKWNEMSPIESDSVVFKKESNGQVVQYQSFRSPGGHGQLIFGIHNRFYLAISTENLSEEELTEISVLIDFEKFPQQ